MRLIHCKKCGSGIVTEEALIERMQDHIHELYEASRYAKDGFTKQSYLAEAKSVEKMMTGIIHNTTELEYRKLTTMVELGALISHVRENNLVTDNTLEKIFSEAREKAKERDLKNQKRIDELYGNFKSSYEIFNKGKDSTAKKAINNVSKKRR